MTRNRKQAIGLYKELLRLHRQMPQEMAALGNTYLKAEWKRHKDAPPSFIPNFLAEWAHYRDTLRLQLISNKIGEQINPERLSSMTDDQIRQLYELKKAVKGE